MRNALEDREVRQRREQEARQDDRLTADLVGQPAEQDEAGRAERERNHDHDLRGGAGYLEGLGQEEQRVELSAVPHHGFAGGGAEQREDRDLGVTPFGEGLAQRPLRGFAFVLHLLEDRGLVKAQANPDRNREQDTGEQERNAPTPIAERTFAHRVADAENEQEREEQAERCRGLDPGGVVAA